MGMKFLLSTILAFYFHCFKLWHIIFIYIIVLITTDIHYPLNFSDTTHLWCLLSTILHKYVLLKKFYLIVSINIIISWNKTFTNASFEMKSWVISHMKMELVSNILRTASVTIISVGCYDGDQVILQIFGY